MIAKLERIDKVTLKDGVETYLITGFSAVLTGHEIDIKNDCFFNANKVISRERLKEVKNLEELLAYVKEVIEIDLYDRLNDGHLIVGNGKDVAVSSVLEMNWCKCPYNEPAVKEETGDAAAKLKIYSILKESDSDIGIREAYIYPYTLSKAENEKRFKEIIKTDPIISTQNIYHEDEGFIETESDSGSLPYCRMETTEKEISFTKEQLTEFLSTIDIDILKECLPACGTFICGSLLDAYIELEVPYRLEECLELSVDDKQKKDLIEYVKNDTNVLFDYDGLDQALLDKFDEITDDPTIHKDMATCISCGEFVDLDECETDHYWTNNGDRIVYHICSHCGESVEPIELDLK